MHFSRAYGVLSALSCLTMSALATSAPSLKHAFSVHVDLGQPVGPIPNPIGGFKVVEPITGGTISGPSFAGTVASGGASAIDFNSNFTIAEVSALLDCCNRSGQNGESYIGRPYADTCI